MNELDIQEPFAVKEEHSEIFSLRSIASSEDILQVIPVYNQNNLQGDFHSGHWSAKQHIKYIMFLDYFSDIFTIKHNKKLWKIFTLMCTFIKTRNSSQCRSHHQKNQRKHKSVEQILKYQRTKYLNYDIQFEKMKKILRKLPIHNPVEIQKQKQTTAFIPSIKVLQQNLDYHVYTPTSMRNLQIPKKSLKDITDRNSQKAIVYLREKYIGSEVSIEMEDESEQCYNDKVRSLNCHIIEPEQNQQKNIWLFNHSGIDSFKKDQKLDATADSYMNEGFKIINQHQIKADSNPAKQSQNSLNHEQPLQENFKSYMNIVKMKKTRSSLPSFDLLDVDDKQLFKLGRRLRNEKKQSILSSSGKCKTLPPLSVKIDSEDSSPSVKISNQQNFIGKSFFSGFISSLDSANKNFQQDQAQIRQNQYTSFNNFAYGKEFSSQGNNLMESIKQSNMSERQYVESKENLLFCEDKHKGNLCNQISDEEFENSMDFVSNQNIMFEQSKQKECFLEKEESKSHNFIKKGSKQSELEHFIKQEQTNKLILPLQQEENIQFNNERMYELQNLHNQSFTNEMQQQSIPIPQETHFYGQNLISYPPLYSPYYFVPHQYPLIQYKLYKFVEFFIYFLIHKVIANNIQYQSQ